MAEVTGASLSFSFYGTAVAIYGTKRRNNGRYQVTVDNTTYPPGNGWSRNLDLWNQELFAVKDLEKGPHLMRLVLSESKLTDVDYVSMKLRAGMSKR